MRIAYLDCFSGASGDMILGALLGAGVSFRGLKKEIEKLGLDTVRISTRNVLRGGIAATRALVEGKAEKRSHRSLKELLRVIDRSGLEPEIKKRSKEVFWRIGSVEAEIHQKPVEEVHFHEIGGLDSVVDIVGAVWGFQQLGIERVYVSKVNVGGGFVQCEHGTLPVPAPATLALMEGRPIYSSGVERELLTPTGAALLTFLGTEFGTWPPMKVERVGYGAGRDDLPHPNVLRLAVGSSLEAWGQEKVTVVETNIDDMNPQFYDYVIERLLSMGALDVFIAPIVMKKNRPAHLLTVILPPEKLNAIVDFILRETTTLGLRWREEERTKADRDIESISTRHGAIRFKIAKKDGDIVNIAPEYEDCKQAALRTKRPLKEVFDEARRAAMAVHRGPKKGA